MFKPESSFVYGNIVACVYLDQIVNATEQNIDPPKQTEKNPSYSQPK